MPTTVAGFVLRAHDRPKTADFYAALGLTIHEHQHGGPLHHVIGPTSEECVLEVYSHSPAYPSDALMLYVESVAVALDNVSRFGITAIDDVREGSDGKFTYINDPDGRPVMLIERTIQPHIV